MSTIGDNIKKRRLELDMTQEELALLMGYKTKSSINKIELGVADIPQSKIVKFAQVLHTSVGALMGGATIIETIFEWKGIGMMAVKAIRVQDFPIIQCYVLWMALALEIIKMAML